jgi:hypothetical protein
MAENDVPVVGSLNQCTRQETSSLYFLPSPSQSKIHGDDLHRGVLDDALDLPESVAGTWNGGGLRLPGYLYPVGSKRSRGTYRLIAQDNYFKRKGF